MVTNYSFFAWFFIARKNVFIRIIRIFSGNSNLVYTIIRKRHVFHALANLPSDVHGISKCLSNRKIAVVGSQPSVQPIREQHLAPTSSAPTKSRQNSTAAHNGDRRIVNGDDDKDSETSAIQPKVNDGSEPSLDTKSDIEESMEGSRPALPAEPGTLKASLPETPAIASMTERESAHPLQPPLCEFTPMVDNCNTNKVQEVNETELAKLTIKENDSNDTIEQPLKRTVNQVLFNLFSISNGLNVNSFIAFVFLAW